MTDDRHRRSSDQPGLSVRQARIMVAMVTLTLAVIVGVVAWGSWVQATGRVVTHENLTEQLARIEARQEVLICLAALPITATAADAEACRAAAE